MVLILTIRLVLVATLPANGSPISLDALEEISINVTPYDVKPIWLYSVALLMRLRAQAQIHFSGSAYTFFQK
jgi:hypothetical protein